jgi:hypothetical protein
MVVSSNMDDGREKVCNVRDALSVNNGAVVVNHNLLWKPVKRFVDMEYYF